jgi:hypothetical protein
MTVLRRSICAFATPNKAKAPRDFMSVGTFLIRDWDLDTISTDSSIVWAARRRKCRNRPVVLHVGASCHSRGTRGPVLLSDSVVRIKEPKVSTVTRISSAISLIFGLVLAALMAESESSSVLVLLNDVQRIQTSSKIRVFEFGASNSFEYSHGKACVGRD